MAGKIEITASVLITLASLTTGHALAATNTSESSSGIADIAAKTRSMAAGTMLDAHAASRIAGAQGIELAQAQTPPAEGQQDPNLLLKQKHPNEGGKPEAPKPHEEQKPHEEKPAPKPPEPPKAEPPRQEQPKPQPPRQEPPKQEAPKQEAPRQEPPKAEPPRQEPKHMEAPPPPPKPAPAAPQAEKPAPVKPQQEAPVEKPRPAEVEKPQAAPKPPAEKPPVEKPVEPPAPKPPVPAPAQTKEPVAPKAAPAAPAPEPVEPRKGEAPAMEAPVKPKPQEPKPQEIAPQGEAPNAQPKPGQPRPPQPPAAEQPAAPARPADAGKAPPPPAAPAAPVQPNSAKPAPQPAAPAPQGGQPPVPPPPAPGDAKAPAPIMPPLNTVQSRQDGQPGQGGQPGQPGRPGQGGQAGQPGRPGQSGAPGQVPEAARPQFSQQQQQPFTPQELQRLKSLAARPDQSNETIILPINNGAPVLDSDKDANWRRGMSDDQLRRMRQQSAQDWNYAVPQSDEQAQREFFGNRQRPPVVFVPIDRNQGRRLQQEPEFLYPEDVRIGREFDGDRRVMDYDGQIVVRGDDNRRFEQYGRPAIYEQLDHQRVRETVFKQNGDRIVTLRNRYGQLIQRSRITADGQEIVLFYSPDLYAADDSRPVIYRDPGASLPPMRLRVPLDDYIIDVGSQPSRDYYDFFEQPPVEPVERVYTIDEVRNSARIRDKMRRVDLDTITFATGSWDISMNQAGSLKKVADAITKVLRNNPGETFMIEGHTDAVGSAEANLVLSDRRAEAVANVLTQVYGIPPENMVTQGYGEQFLKVMTYGPEQQNRRVTIRRVTPLVRPVQQ